MSIHRFKYLFQQFVNKTATSEEVGEFLSMMKRDDYNKEVQDLLDEFWNEPSSITPMGEENAERIFNQIMANSPAEEPVRVFSIKANWYKAVAAILVIGLSVFFYKVNSPGSEIRTANVNSIITVKPDKPGRRFINLPDGSSVILNENSKIELGKNFNSDGNREVYLNGEAYFDIVHDANHPFIVHTGKIKTTVLGTAFNIKANPGSKLITVTVTRGKVKVGDDDHTYNVIVPDEQVVFDQVLSNHVKKPIKAESVIEWTNEDMYFDDVSIKDVANQLQERFDVKIVFSNEQIKSCKFSATFLKTQSLEQILNIIGEFNQIKYQFQGAKTVVLDGSGCQ
ncbi:ferric-dicitrate binding protein FerR, regulates iron transport through sigma-19 [Daejeonella rubra]|uniref:Ferric-dicitrate binding protein FerR, regulates iron transport through sigma-19 n=1 Tax=Daejeonella rubra TaxID=990371 RepID=A0A1G9TIY0_9SPHI|nr:FecR domain-containing protein [Daejeonella rubra]SDM47726.1 ferric-dicitrate binding protein FerR, regulates iron transport through sigma-19 [Daejeonella rubra]